MAQTITAEEINAGLEAAGITIDSVKAAFKVLFPEATNIIESSSPPSASTRISAVTLMLGFKAGILAGLDIFVKRDTKSASFVVSEDAVGPLEVRNGVLMNCTTCGRLYMVPHEVDVDAFICPLCIPPPGEVNA